MADASIFLISGTDDFNIRRGIKRLKQTTGEAGFQSIDLDAGDPQQREDLLDMIATSGLVISTPTLVIVHNPHKLDPDFILDLIHNPDPECLLLLYVDGTIDKRSKFAKTVVPEIKSKQVYDEPPSYDAVEVARKFVIAEVAGLGHTISKRMAASLVKRSGTNLGILSFEVFKAVTLEDDKEISIDTLRKSFAPLATVDVDGLASALISKDRSRISRELVRIRAQWVGDPTMAFCGKLTPVVLQWIKAVSLRDQGHLPDEAADLVGSNKWYWRTVVVPEAKRFKIHELFQIISTISKAQKATRTGAIAPWTLFETGLIMSIDPIPD